MKVSYFGYRVGSPAGDADLVIDCRTIRNPHSLGGSDEDMRARVLADPVAQALLKVAEDHMLKGGKHVAFGCSFGRHRSFALAREMRRRIDEGSRVRE